MKHTLTVLCLLLIAAVTGKAAGIAYGSITNFDTVNDTGHICHGFEIEIEDCHSTDISHTYNYNHYGAPKITEDNSVPAHPKCIIRWESKKNTDGSWAAYTAIPSGPINPTNGHQFTNPNVNFGGEHFGVGYRVAVGAVKYNWLIDNGSGTLVHGGAVSVAAPSFTYYAPAGGNPARVQAAIKPPELPEIPVKEFGPAVWVKEIRTETHNNEKIKLRELVSDDPDDDDEKNWANGEPDEVEVEWQILQEEYGAGDGGGNGELMAAPEDLDNGDEVVTRRYEFYEYTGPYDENGEAKADKVGPDGVHGEGIKEINGVDVDLSTVVVVGEYKGAQMAAVDAAAGVTLIDHVSEGQINQAYPGRTVVVQGINPFTSTMEGDLPAGMTFNTITGILSGTPTESGEFQFKITAFDAVTEAVSKNYVLLIAEFAAAPPPMSVVDTQPTPVIGGTTTGDGAFEPDSDVMVSAEPEPGFTFLHWRDNNEVVSTSPVHHVTADVNHTLVAQFGPEPKLQSGSTPGSLKLVWIAADPTWVLEESPTMAPGSWMPSALVPVVNGDNNEVTLPPGGNQRFYRLKKP